MLGLQVSIEDVSQLSSSAEFGPNLAQILICQLLLRSPVLSKAIAIGG